MGPVVCPGTRRQVSDGADTTPGVAADVYTATKSARYADQHNFVPFIVETGGRANQASRSSTCCRAWKEQMWPLCWWMVGRRGLGLLRSHIVASGLR